MIGAASCARAHELHCNPREFCGCPSYFLSADQQTHAFFSSLGFISKKLGIRNYPSEPLVTAKRKGKEGFNPRMLRLKATPDSNIPGPSTPIHKYKVEVANQQRVELTSVSVRSSVNSSSAIPGGDFDKFLL